MKPAATLLAITVILSLSSCKQNKEDGKLPFADIEFTIYDLRAVGDSTISEFNYPSSIILKSDFTWSIDVEGTKSNGTYTWSPVSNQQVAIKFTIVKWNDFSANPQLSDKLKSALLSVNHCGYSLTASAFANFLVNNYQGDHFPFIRTNKK